MSEQKEKIDEFISKTGATEDTARLFLDSATWQLEAAITRYNENDGDDSNTVEGVTSGEKSSRIPVSIMRSKPNSNFATMNTITSSSEDEEDREAYYAGGSETSGQQVLGPPKNTNIAADIFRSVQEHGVPILEQSASSSNSRAFHGTGYKLGQDENDTEVVPEIAVPSEVTLRLWQNGFTVNDGDLRLYTDTTSKEFLEAVREGRIPEELLGDTSEIHLAIEDHRTQAFEPQVTSNAFQGLGHTLGSPTSTVVDASSEGEEVNNEAKALELLKLDESKPTTNLQIRLADGSRIVGQFNQEHTIAEIRAFIQAARPQYQNHPFNLLASFPAQVLDDSLTIEDAGITNAVIIQKLI